jgi:hypothetical protein
MDRRRDRINWYDSPQRSTDLVLSTSGSARVAIGWDKVAAMNRHESLRGPNLDHFLAREMAGRRI